MKSTIRTLQQQLRGNAVAFISLFIALSGLGYNTWRNETTEYQRNVRFAAFRLIDNLGELQSVVNAMVYASTDDDDRWVVGWGKILVIESLGAVMPPPVPEQSLLLKHVWAENFDNLEARPELATAADGQISGQIEATRLAVLEVLAGLD